MPIDVKPRPGSGKKTSTGVKILAIAGGFVLLLLVLGIIGAMTSGPSDTTTTTTTPATTTPAPATTTTSTPDTTSTSSSSSSSGEAESTCPVCGGTGTYMGMFSGFPGYICYNHSGDQILFVCNDEYDFKMWSYYSDYKYDEYLSEDELHTVSWYN